MSTAILSALRLQTQLHGNTFLVATEIAHRMNSSGYVRMAYDYIAMKAHCCKRTAISQVARLITEHRLFRKYVFRTKHGNAINLYQYRGTIVHQASPPATTRGATVATSLPPPEREKELSLEDEVARQRKGLRFLTEGSDIWERVQEDIARLEGLCHVP